MSGKLPRVDVGLVDDIDVSITVSDEYGSVVTIVYEDLHEAVRHAKMVSSAVEQAMENRKNSKGSES